MYLLLGILVKNLKIDVTLHLISVFSIRFIVEADAEGQKSGLNWFSNFRWVDSKKHNKYYPTLVLFALSYKLSNRPYFFLSFCTIFFLLQNPLCICILLFRWYRYIRKLPHECDCSRAPIEAKINQCHFQASKLIEKFRGKFL